MNGARETGASEILENFHNFLRIIFFDETTLHNKLYSLVPFLLYNCYIFIVISHYEAQHFLELSNNATSRVDIRVVQRVRKWLRFYFFHRPFLI